MSRAKVHIVITDHGTEHLGKSTIAGLTREGFQFSGFVPGNPEVRANGMSEADVVTKIMVVLLSAPEPGSRKIVEVDAGDLMLATDVMNG